jgi:hypothetical protein
MSKLEILAIKSLPPRLDLDGSIVARFGDLVVYENPATTSMLYENYMWRPMSPNEVHDLALRREPFTY